MSSAVTPPPRNRPRRVRRSSSPRPFVVTSTRSSSTRRVSASRSRASATSATTTGSSSRRPSSRRSRALVAASIGSSSRGGAAPAASAWTYRGRPGRFRRRTPAASRRLRSRGRGSRVRASSRGCASREGRAHVRGAPQAEVRGLVPAVAGRAERVDDLLEVALHRVGLPHELVAVRVREARPGLRLELVARQVLRFEREGFGQIGVEIGGALAGDAVDEIERDVVESGITKSVHRPTDVVRRRLPLERLEQMRPERLCAERDASHTGRAASTRDARRSPSRDSPRPSPRSRTATPRAAARARASSVNVGVPPPRNTVSTSSASTWRSCSSSASNAST